MDQLILEKAKKGDVDAFAELLTLYRPLIIKVCRHYMHNKEDAEDATVEAEARLWLGLEGYKRNDNFDGFVYRIAANVCLSILQHMNTQKAGGGVTTIRMGTMRISEDSEQTFEVPDPTEDVEAKVIKKEQNAYLRSCLLSLPEDQHDALYLTQMHGFSYEEAGKMLGVSEGTVKSRVNRARDKIKKLMEEWDPAQGKSKTLKKRKGDKNGREELDNR